VKRAACDAFGIQMTRLSDLAKNPQRFGFGFRFRGW